MAPYGEEQCILEQIKEIRLYLEKCGGENPNIVIMRWIEENAETYRQHWNDDHIN